MASAGRGAAHVTRTQGSLALPLTDAEVLVLQGPGLTAEDRDILAAFAAQLATALESDRLHAEAAEADSLARANQLRSALLAAVSHDLRTPLASIKAASSSLLSDQLEFGPDETGILLRTIDDEADRLSTLVENLLDMSRLETGAMEVLSPAHRRRRAGRRRPGQPRAPGPGRDRVRRARPPPDRHRPGPDRAGGGQPGRQRPPPRGGQGGAGRGRRGGRTGRHPGHRPRSGHPGRRPRPGLPAVPAAGRHDNRTGVGLGLAVSRGFAEAVGGELDLEDTPGGGCTLVIRLPAPVDHTPTIIDADLDEDVAVPDGAEDGRTTPSTRRPPSVTP